MTRPELHRIRRPVFDATTYKRPLMDATGARPRKPVAAPPASCAGVSQSALRRAGTDPFAAIVWA